MTPLYYLKYKSKYMVHQIKNCKIYQEKPLQSDKILFESKVEEIKILGCGIGSSKLKSARDKQKIVQQFEESIQNFVKDHTVAFTDGSVIGEGIESRGGCAVAMLIEDGEYEIVVKDERLGLCINNVDAEISGIALALEEVGNL